MVSLLETGVWMTECYYIKCRAKIFCRRKIGQKIYIEKCPSNLFVHKFSQNMPIQTLYGEAIWQEFCQSRGESNKFEMFSISANKTINVSNKLLKLQLKVGICHKWRHGYYIFWNPSPPSIYSYLVY